MTAQNELSKSMTKLEKLLRNVERIGAKYPGYEKALVCIHADLKRAEVNLAEVLLDATKNELKWG
jgi:hypothetical protein